MSIAIDPGSKAAIPPPSAEQHLLDLRRGREHRDQHLRPAGAFGHRTGGPGARFDERGERGLIEIERRYVKARLHEVAAHRTAHVAEPDEPDPDHSATQVVFRCVFASSACSERSRPCPESLTPPNGVVSDDATNRPSMNASRLRSAPFPGPPRSTPRPPRRAGRPGPARPGRGRDRPDPPSPALRA